MINTIKTALGAPVLTRLAARFGSARVAVLCFHDVREDDDFQSWMRVGISQFARQLQDLSRVGHFIAPADLEDPTRLKPGQLNILVTFDDGYINNLTLALPVLEQLRVPALFFVSTDHIQSGQLFWPDLVITPVQLLNLEELDLREHGFGRYRFRRKPSTRWEDVGALLRDLKDVGNANHPRVAAVLDDINGRFGEQIADHLSRYRPLTEAELRQMVRSKWVHLGSHAHQHEILTYLDDEQLERSLSKSKQWLEGIVEGPIDHLAYPNGNVDRRVIGAMRRSGYRYGYLTAGGLAEPLRDSFRLPRVMVGGYDPPGVTRFLINRHLLAATMRG